jgi:hypothetical protein
MLHNSSSFLLSCLARSCVIVDSTRSTGSSVFWSRITLDCNRFGLQPDPSLLAAIHRGPVAGGHRFDEPRLDKVALLISVHRRVPHRPPRLPGARIDIASGSSSGTIKSR